MHPQSKEQVFNQVGMKIIPNLTTSNYEWEMNGKGRETNTFTLQDYLNQSQTIFFPSTNKNNKLTMS